MLRYIGRLSSGILSAFGDWFASGGGVWETAVVMLGLTSYYLVRGALGHAIFFLAILTVYSGITQPILALVARAAGKKTDEALAKLMEVEERLATLEEEHGRLLAAIALKVGA